MNREEVRRVTVDEDTRALVAKQVYIETRSGQIELQHFENGLQRFESCRPYRIAFVD